VGCVVSAFGGRDHTTVQAESHKMLSVRGRDNHQRVQEVPATGNIQSGKRGCERLEREWRGSDDRGQSGRVGETQNLPDALKREDGSAGEARKAPKGVLCSSLKDSPQGKRGVSGHRVGDWHGMARLDESAVRYIRANYFAYIRGYGHLAQMFGVKDSTVRDIVTYRTWRHVQD